MRGRITSSRTFNSY